MRVFLDTSVLIAAMLKGHPSHAVALSWLQRIQQRTDVGLVAAHSLAESYAVLTRLPQHPRISPGLAVQLIKVNVLATCEVIALSASEYRTLLDHLSEVQVAGGAVYDALLLHAAQKANVEQIVTLNEAHFRRVYPALASKTVAPQARA